MSDIKDSENYLKKVKYICKIIDGAILVMADLMSFYPSINYKGGFKTVSKRLNERDISVILSWWVRYIEGIFFKWDHGSAIH